MRNVLSYKIYIASGNPTAIITLLPGENVPDGRERHRLNDEIMALHPELEQLGFLIPEDGLHLPRLVMAGGEFCGNATRCAAFELLEGKEGTLKIEVSGAGEPLECGVKGRDAWCILPEPECRASSSIPGAFVCSMEGISHIVIFDGTALTKDIALSLMEAEGLLKCPATGVVQLSCLCINDGNGTVKCNMKPVVRVRDIDTLFEETACGSGAVAAAAALRYRGIAGPFSFIQPYGMELKVSAEIDVRLHSDKKSFRYVLSGEVKQY